MKIPKEPERGLAWHVIDLKIVIAADVIKETGVGRSADRGEVEFHFNPADCLKVLRVYQPLAPFTVTF